MLDGCVGTNIEYDHLTFLIKVRGSSPIDNGITHLAPIRRNASSLGVGIILIGILIDLDLCIVHGNGLTGDRKEWLCHLTNGYNASTSSAEMIDQGNVIFYR